MFRVSRRFSFKIFRVGPSLEDGRIHDDLRQTFYSTLEPSVYCIPSGYADAQLMPKTGQLVSFTQLWGGRSYQSAFAQRLAKSIERVSGSKVSMLHQATKPLGGEKLSYCDCSVKICSLPLVSITIVLWRETSEFPALANILFDSSANNYLSSDQLVMLSELTSARLRHAYEVLITEG